VSAHLFKATAKRRRSKVQIEEEKRQAKRQKQEVDEKLVQMEEMQQTMFAMHQKMEEDDHKVQAVTKLFEDGKIIINQQGEFKTLADPKQQQEAKNEYARQSKSKQGVNQAPP